jgi:hypothetical protein
MINIFQIMKSKPESCAVLLPTFNSPRYLGEAIESILDQTYRDFRLYILDGGSNDATIDIAKAWAGADRRIKVKVFPGMHPTERVDLMISKLKCEYIALQHSDDISYRDRLTRQIDAFTADPALAVSSALCRNFWHLRNFSAPNEGAIVHSRPLTHQEIEAELLFWPAMHCPTLMLRRSLIEKARLQFSNQFQFCNDWWMTIKNIKKLRHSNIDAELSSYRMHLASDGPRHVELLRQEERELREEALKFFGFKATPQQLALHQEIRIIPDQVLSVAPEEFSEVFCWLDELARQNEVLKIFEPVVFGHALARIKEGVLAIARKQDFTSI